MSIMKDKTDIIKVSEFHNACDTCRDARVNREDVDVLQLRIRLITEEFNEYIGELRHAVFDIKNYGFVYSSTLERITAENADMRYILAGDADVLGLPTDLAFNRIHAANMRKVGTDGKVKRREDGKVLKPDDWEPPKFSDLFE